MQGWGLSADCQSSPSSLAKSKGTQPGVGGRVRWSLWQMTEWQEWSTVEYADLMCFYIWNIIQMSYTTNMWYPRWELRTEEAVSFQAGLQSDWNFYQRILPATCSLSLSPAPSSLSLILLVPSIFPFCAEGTRWLCHQFVFERRRDDGAEKLCSKKDKAGEYPGCLHSQTSS